MKKRETFGVAIILLFIISLRFANLFFVWFAILVLLMLNGSKMWLNYLEKKLTAEIRLKTHRMFPNELVEGEVVIANRGIFPVFGLQVEFDFWRNLSLESNYFITHDKELIGSSFTTYRGDFNLNRKEKLIIPFTITGTDRGSYTFKEIKLQIGDPLGLEVTEKRVSIFEELLIYPNEIELQGLDQTHRIPQGESVVKRWIQEDIFFPVGARPYQFGDSFNRIDFKTTAKLQKLHTKKFDYTAHGDICVIANLLTSSYKWIFEEAHFERTLSIIARLSRESLNKDLRFSFFANAQAGKGMRVFEIPSSSGRQHYRKILEVLARFSLIHATPFNLALAKMSQRYPNGSLVVVVTSYLDDEMMEEMNMLVNKGFEVYVVDSVVEVPQIERWSFYSWRERESSHG